MRGRTQSPSRLLQVPPPACRPPSVRWCGAAERCLACGAALALPSWRFGAFRPSFPESKAPGPTRQRRGAAGGVGAGTLGAGGLGPTAQRRGGILCACFPAHARRRAGRMRGGRHDDKMTRRLGVGFSYGPPAQCQARVKGGAGAPCGRLFCPRPRPRLAAAVWGLPPSDVIICDIFSWPLCGPRRALPAAFMFCLFGLLHLAARAAAPQPEGSPTDVGPGAASLPDVAPVAPHPAPVSQRAVPRPPPEVRAV